ncbi:MAG: hypothetical protein AB1401_11015 [Thermodesulfobacteriota bacterium]
MKITYVFLKMVTSVSIVVLLGVVSSYAGEVRGVTKDTIIMGNLNADTGPIAKDSQSLSEGVKNYVR